MNVEKSVTGGTVVAIYICGRSAANPRAIAEVRAVAGRGLEGDRYFEGTGAFPRWPGEGRAVSLIERESWDNVLGAAGADLSLGQHRRNIVTAGIDLQSLIGRQFRVGEAIFRGTRECTVCGYLDRVSGLKLAEVLGGRGGLRADVISDGVIRVGDTVTVL